MNARVLPDPVSATPTVSRPDAAMGQHTAWIGVGFENDAHARSTLAPNPVSANAATGRPRRRRGR